MSAAVFEAVGRVPEWRMVAEDGSTLVAGTEVGLAWTWAAHTWGVREWVTMPLAERWVSTAAALVELQDLILAGELETGCAGFPADRVMRTWREASDAERLEDLGLDLRKLRAAVAVDRPEAVEAVDAVIRECESLYLELVPGGITWWAA